MEDAALASMLVADILVEEGFRIAGPFARSGEGLRWLENNRPDAVLLDVLLVDGPCYTLADELERRGIPYVFHSVWMHHDIPPRFWPAPWLDKPAAVEALLATLNGIVHLSPALKAG
jgi:DNA-binding NarL/FixJ family response regulator